MVLIELDKELNLITVVAKQVILLKIAEFETIMINCNPETVSTDYDTSDRLYFEPLKEEYVYNIIKKEQQKGNLIGIIAQFGGQTPIKLAKFLNDNKLPILRYSIYFYRFS